jgi:16S rRNA G966 N2-methylase RsmD
LKKSAKEILQTLSSGPVQRYILENENQDVREMVLRNKVLFSIPAAQLSEQISSRRKAKEKLPLYYDTSGIIYPPPKNLEQSSSQATALFKTRIMLNVLPGKEAICADLTGGFGIDSYFFSKTVKKIHYVEPDPFLLEIAKHNHELLGAANIEYHTCTAEAFVQSTSVSFDFIFLDPSRREETGKKIHALADSHPNVLPLKNNLFSKTPLILLKASPLLDIQAGAAELGGVKNVFVISVKNECKEVLFLCERDFTGTPLIEAVNILEGDSFDQFRFTFPEEQNEKVGFSDPLKYLYEPNASILKAGAFKSVATRFNVKKVARNTHLYTGAELIEAFPGKKFEIEKFVKPDASEVKPYFPEAKANVTTRNYPMTPEALRKKTGLKDGGEKYLIGLSGERKKILLVAKRL